MICLIVIEVFLIVIGVINYTVSTKAVVLTEISKINLKEYINHKNGKDKDENDDESGDENNVDEDTVMDEIEKKLIN